MVPKTKTQIPNYTIILFPNSPNSFRRLTAVLIYEPLSFKRWVSTRIFIIRTRWHTHVRERGNEVKLEMEARSHVLLLLHLTDFTNY